MKFLRQNFSVVRLLLLIGVLSFFSLGQRDIRPVMAGPGDNVYGFAWNANTGWISFNSTDCDADRNNFIDSGACGGDNATDAVIDYGVSMDLDTGVFSGYAWSPSVGWIDFGPTSGYPEAPFAPVVYNSGDYSVSGWAQIIAMGDDGWIKITSASVDEITGQFSGWGWNGNDDISGIGWISFDSTDCDADDNGFIDVAFCGNIGDPISAHEVIVVFNNPPEAVNLSAPNCNFVQAASLGALNCPQLLWEYSDIDDVAPDFDPQSRYQVIIDTNYHDVSSLDGLSDGSGSGLPLKTSELAGAATSFFPASNSHRSVSLDYNTQYYWWVKVWDSNNGDSGWTEGPSFTTYSHEMPNPDFSWFPVEPSMGEEVLFIDESQIYLDAAPNTPVDCDEIRCDWYWTFEGGTPATSTDSGPIIVFDSEGSHAVTLTITDEAGYVATSSQSLDIGVSLPNWKEVK